MAFKNENVDNGIPPNAQFRAGESNVDSGRLIEGGIPIPWPTDPLTTWVYYDCTVGVMLDSGLVVHNHLPQVDNAPDTLAMCDLEDPNLDRITGLGINLNCRDQYKDIIQRMGHGRYWFRLWGQALRIGFQVPIPSIKSIGGVPVVPYDTNPQWAFNRIAPGGNYNGGILWHAGWSLWYTTLTPPKSRPYSGGEFGVPAADPYAHINGRAAQPQNGVQVPYSASDADALPAAPPQNAQF